MKSLNFCFIFFLLLSELSFAQCICDNPLRIKPFEEVISLSKKLNNHFSLVSLDTNLIRSWEANSKLPCLPPFSATYKIGKKEIVFVAVQHVSGPTDPNEDSLKILNDLIEKEKPQGVVVETVSGGVMPPQAFDGFKNNCYQDKDFVCGEAAFAAMVAGKNKAEVQGGEPIPPVLNEAILRVESKDSLLAYRSTQAILSFKRQGVPQNEWSRKLPEELGRNAIAPNDIWSYAQYSNWLRNNLKSQPEQVEESWIEPRGDNSATILQRISAKIDSIREPLIVGTMEQVLNKHDKSMILYGAGHFFKQANVLEKALGNPQIQCLNKN